ncbi:MAG: NfeD family protein [Solirubrobacterales bacterium]
MILVIAIALAVFVLQPPFGFVVIAGALVVEIFEIWLMIRLSGRGRPSVGAESLPGTEGLAMSACRPSGQVRLRGEIWSARCDPGADAGDPVTVVEVQGLTLHVVPAGEPDRVP